MNRETLPRVALVVETSTSFGRRLISGVAAYVREHSPWSIYYSERGVFDPVPSWLENWQGDGIISRTSAAEIRKVIAASGTPAVDLVGQLADLGVPRILIDNAAVGQVAARHLLERGFANFGYLGDSGHSWSDEREQAFKSELRAAGCDCRVWAAAGGPEDIESLRQGLWNLQLDGVAEWVDAIPKPAAIFACHDFRALQLLAACRLAGAAVPNEVAVLGVGADDVAWELSDPPLSSIVLNAWRMGYEAAATLDAMMRGKPPETMLLRIPPLDVLTRQSTDVTAIADPVVARALRFIRDHATKGINVNTVLKHVGISRSALQDHFRRALGRPIHDVIVEVRLSRVKELLAGTDLPLDAVAERTGFTHPEYMSSFLKQRTGWTPARYRREHGRRP